MNVQQMNDPHLNAWIAEHIMHIPRERIFYTALGMEMVSTQIEEYATDRNACAEMEAEIARRGSTVKYLYLGCLCDVTGTDFELYDYKTVWLLTTATPRQRCEAAYIAMQEPQP
ncbi:MAG TPA: hypothetical protein VFT66_15525 [Roseiflexaceae bacterium]|nr:hypothetical protein [Roseiflexaceae bacterium]